MITNINRDSFRSGRLGSPSLSPRQKKKTVKFKARGCIATSIFVKNPIMFMIMLDLVTFIITIIESAHIKSSLKDPDVNADECQQNKIYKNFNLSMVLLALLFIRLFGMFAFEFARIRYYSFFKSVKTNLQIMILIGRLIFNIIVLLPYFWICFAKNLLEKLNFWLPLIVLFLEEFPSIFLTFYLFFCGDREQRYKTQDNSQIKIDQKQDIEQGGINQIQVDRTIFSEFGNASTEVQLNNQMNEYDFFNAMRDRTISLPVQRESILQRQRAENSMQNRGVIEEQIEGRVRANTLKHLYRDPYNGLIDGRMQPSLSSPYHKEQIFQIQSSTKNRSISSGRISVSYAPNGNQVCNNETINFAILKQRRNSDLISQDFSQVIEAKVKSKIHIRLQASPK